MAVYFFYGQEYYLMDKEIKRLKSELLDVSFLSMSYKMLDNPEFPQLMECLQSSPLMFGNTLSLIYLERYLLGNDLSYDDKQIESIDFALKNINDSVNIIFFCEISRDEIKKKVDKRKKLFKTISKYAQVREFPILPTYDEIVPSEIVKMAKEKDLTISSNVISSVISQLGTNLALINCEFDKLKNAIHPKKTIDVESLQKYCTSKEDVFSLIDLILKGKKDEIVKQYSLLTEKRHPLEILGALQTSFRRFVFIKNYEKSMNNKEIALKLKIHEYVVKTTREKLAKISLERLVDIRKKLLEAELKNKTSDSFIGEIILELAILG